LRPLIRQANNIDDMNDAKAVELSIVKNKGNTIDILTSLG